MAAALRPEYLGEIRTADDPEGYSRLHFTFQQVVCQAFIIRAVESGFIVCIPRKAAPETELASSAANAFGGDFGPWTEFDLKAVSSAGNEISKRLKVALIDCNIECFPLLSVEAPVDVDVEVLIPLETVERKECGCEVQTRLASCVSLWQNSLGACSGHWYHQA